MERFWIACAAVVAFAACNPKSLRPGYCHTDKDCTMGKTCNPKTLMCWDRDASTDGEAKDGGDAMDGADAMDGGDAMDGADAKDAEVAPPPPRCPTTLDCADGGYDGSAGVCVVEAGVCVECLVDGDCASKPKTPICENQRCRACKADSECKSGPGVCMFHQDGHCATDAETIYVKNATGCSMNGGGTKDSPYCNSQDGLSAVGTRTLVVMRGPDALTEWTVPTAPVAPVTVVGQSNATVNPGARIGIRVSAGSIYIRDLKVSMGSNIGVIAETGADLTMDHCTVSNNTKGGIFVDGANFDIKNTTVTGNGPSADLTWGGIRVQTLLGTGNAKLKLLTVQMNNPSGVSCSGPISGDGVSATQNVSGDISMTCGFMSCGAPAPPTCGAQ